MARAGTVYVDVKAETSGFLRDVTQAGQGAARSLAGLAASGAKTVLSDIGTMGGTAALGLGVLGGAALKASSDFDAAMSGVQAVSNASVQELDALRDAALEAGKATVFSASDAAVAQGELAKAGIGTADILSGALRGSLDLAAAGQLELGRAAEISAQAMNLFNLQGSDVSRVADVLAAGANKSAADVEQLAQGMQQGGLVAGQLGLSLEDTVGVLSLFADNALVGSDAGTSLKTMLQRLVPTTKEQTNMMNELGLSFFDADGKFVGLEETARRLQTQMGGLTDEQRLNAMTTIFGADAIRAANLLYQSGAEGVRDYTAAVNDQGAAQRMASTMLDNLKGDVEAFKGSAETALIQIGGLLDGTARAITQAATDGLNGFLTFADSPAFEQIGVRIDQLGTRAAAALGGLGDAVDEALGGLTVADVNAFFDRVESGFDTIRDAAAGAEPLIAGVGVALGSMALSSIPLIGGLLPAISPLTGALGGLVLGSEQGRDALARLGEVAATVGQTAFTDVLAAIGEVAGEIGGSLGQAIEALGTGAIDAAGVLGPILGQAIRELGPPLGELVAEAARLGGEVLPDLASIAGSVLMPAIDVLGPVLSTAADAMSFLADNSEIVIPLLGAFAGFKLAGVISGWIGPLKGLGDMIGQVGQIAATQGVSNLTAFKGVLTASAGEAGSGLASALSGVLNPAVLGVTAAVSAGIGIYSAWSSAKSDAEAATRSLADALTNERDALGSTADALRERLSDLRGDDFTDEFNRVGLSVREVSDDLRAFPGAMDEFRGLFQGVNEDWEFFDQVVAQAEDAGIRVPDAVFKIRDAVEAGIISPSEGSELINIFTDLDKASAVAGDNLVAQFNDLKAAADDVGIDLGTFKQRFDDALTVEDKQAVIDEIVAQFPQLADAIGETGVSAEETQRQIEGLIGALKELEGTQLAVDQAQQDFTLSQERLLQALGQNGLTLDQNTAAGARNRQALDAMVEGGKALADAQARTDQTGQQSQATFDRMTGSIQQLANQIDPTGQLYEELLATYGLTPEQIRTEIDADTAAAKREVDDLRAQLNSMPGVPEPVRARIEALLNQGQVNAARAELEQFNRTYTARVLVQVEQSGGVPYNIATIERATGQDINKNGQIGAMNGMIRMAAGGFLPGEALIQPEVYPEGLVNWAEPGTGGEAIIPLAESKRKRSKDIWWETGRRLGVLPFADGGIRTASFGAGGFTADTLWGAIAESMQNAWQFQFDQQDSAGQLRMLREKLAGLHKFSDEWMRTMSDITRMEGEVARERAEQAKEIADNRWQYQFDRADRDAQIAMARRQRDSFKQFTDEWMRFNDLLERLQGTDPGSTGGGFAGRSGGGGSGLQQVNHITVEATGLITDPVGTGMAVAEALEAAARAGREDPWGQR
jgi:TP901 family phage tail tape measure protein